MARKSVAAKTVQPVISLPKKIPEPPEHLTERQGEIWRLVMASPVGDMLTSDGFPLLVEYARCITHCDRVAQQIDEFDDGWLADDEGLKRLDLLMKMQDRLQNRIGALATKLRITPQSRALNTTATTISTKGSKRKPWQFEND